MAAKKRKKLKSPADNKSSAQLIHDRIAKELPINAVIAPSIVDDPYERGEKINVVVSLRDDPLRRLHIRGQIDDAQFAAGRAWQRDYEASEIGGIRAFEIKDPVDGGGNYPEPITDRHKRAVLMLTRADRVLGYIGCQIVRYVLAERMFLQQVAERFGYTSQREVDFISRRFRECLDTLAVEIYNLAGRPK